MELIIVRHALPESEKRDDGPADPPLSPLGLQQAEATADLLATEGVDHVVTSTMQRAIQTGRPLANRLGLTPERLGDLKESDYRRNSYTPVEEMGADHEVIREFLNDPLSMFADGYEAFRDRVTVALDAVVADNRGRTVAVFCHAMVVGVYLQTLLGLNDPFAVMADYCGITRVAASSTGIRSVRSFNETGHLRDLV